MRGRAAAAGHKWMNWRGWLLLAFASGMAAGALAAAFGSQLGPWGRTTLAVAVAALWANYGWDHPDV